jgi:glutamate--cysteine ligase
VTAEYSQRTLLLRNAIHAASFAPALPTRRVGAEVEMLALDDASGHPLSLLHGPRSLVRILRGYAARNGWREGSGYGAVPTFEIPGRGIVSFEPGGQLELSTVPSPTITELVRSLQSVVAPLRDALRDRGVRLESIGIDPLNDARDIPLQLPVERYETMTRYFDRRGPYGVRMMRQTAALQISLDRGSLPADRWRLLNDLVPYVIAIFANSPHYRGETTGHQSYRAHCWRTLDATRTGVSAPHTDPALAYAEFALAANDMPRSLYTDVSFAARGLEQADDADWRTHLTTLFPEVRPRGHYEVRSCDAIPVDLYAAPIVFLAGIAYDDRAAREAGILASDSRALLRTAGEMGLRDVSIARTARDLFQLALSGARRLGEAYCGGAEVEIASEFFATYTARDRSPADERVLAQSRLPGTIAAPTT